MKKDAVSGVAKRRYWRAADARVVVDAWRQSRKSAGRFAVEVGIEPERLRRWVRRLRGGRRDSVAFHPVRVVPEQGRVSHEPIELLLGAGVCLRIPAGCALEDMMRVVVVVKAGLQAC